MSLKLYEPNNENDAFDRLTLVEKTPGCGVFLLKLCNSHGETGPGGIILSISKNGVHKYSGFSGCGVIATNYDSLGYRVVASCPYEDRDGGV